ncbi:MAG TPA: hypothetical protein VKV16_05625, partial [Solirubrobacteraceae bacterium]|nr:hypothetical protein [Solirubrobacteraceae bacterium]
RAAPRMIYEATEKGVERFESWMRGASRLPPQRDELHMKIALARPRDVPGLIDAVYEQELACTQRLRELGPHGALELSGGAHDWSRRMRGVRAAAEIASWQARVEWLRSARALLESLLEDGASRAHAPARERAAHLG